MSKKNRLDLFMCNVRGVPFNTIRQFLLNLTSVVYFVTQLSQQSVSTLSEEFAA